MANRPSREIVEKLQELADKERVAAKIHESIGNHSDARAAQFRAENWQEVVDNARRDKDKK